MFFSFESLLTVAVFCSSLTVDSDEPQLSHIGTTGFKIQHISATGRESVPDQ